MSDPAPGLPPGVTGSIFGSICIEIIDLQWTSGSPPHNTEVICKFWGQPQDDSVILHPANLATTGQRSHKVFPIRCTQEKYNLKFTLINTIRIKFIYLYNLNFETFT